MNPINLSKVLLMLLIGGYTSFQTSRAKKQAQSHAAIAKIRTHPIFQDIKRGSAA